MAGSARAAARRGKPATPRAAQRRSARAITAWYLENYHDTPEDPGVGRMFCDPSRVGHFAVSPEALRAGDAAALFKTLVATTMFQRRQDLQIQRVLRGISAEDTAELTDPARLLALADSGCPHSKSIEALLSSCDLRKDEGRGGCSAEPSRLCALKRHTELLKRYGHFGKVPTSIALTLRHHQTPDLPTLRRKIIASSRGPVDAAEALEAALSKAWRVSEKIAAMYLSMVTNPDLSPGFAPWSEGVDWTHYVVIDSNVDLYLKASGYPGPWTYAWRRRFIQRLARTIDLSSLKPGLNPYNPRIVQQALYLFMSLSNRRAIERDCGALGEEACQRCLPTLRALCPRRR